MPTRQNNIVKNIDWVTVTIYLLMVIAGWFCIYGAVYHFEDASFWDFSYRYGKQLVWIGLSIGIAFTLLMLDSRLYNLFAYEIYAILMLLLLVTIFVAPEIKGSRSWLVLGPVSLQPAEFAKTATCLAVARVMSTTGFKVTRLGDFVKVICFILFPMLLILLQNETGSALVYASLLLVLYREGLPGIILILLFFLAVIFVVSIRFGDVPILAAFPDESYGLFLVILITLAVQNGFLLVFQKDRKITMSMVLFDVIVLLLAYLVYKIFHLNFRFTYVGYGIIAVKFIYLIVISFQKRLYTYFWIGLFAIASVGISSMSDMAFDKLKPHQQSRIRVTLGMENDPQKAGYNVNQSKIAIGSGGVSGKGFLNGTQTKLKYVPEQDTDFIFCTVGEEHGFVGSFVVMILFLILMLRLVFLAERQRSLFSRIYGYCVASIIFFHVAVNIGMVIGLTPVIGIPLPFFSYGGSSLWGFTILLFIFLRLDASRTEYFG
ncbi:MAG: rod shape-determining protein RodA [Paludibacteraceae bacterium]|nr:rod shape-determining protein RodA [Paludibacteraceae bacterium]